ncbi:MAG: LysR family transcriptional regulator, partial [Halocynthiibacter sp.]
GVHHATVIRHIDALEKQLGTKLFQRHARGYTPTEAGNDLMQVAQTTNDQFSQLAGRIRGQGEAVTGDLVVTSLASLSPQLAPVLVGFQKEHPEVRVHFLTGERLFRLEYGEAHVAIRAGKAPDQPDNVVQPLMSQCVALYGAKSYLASYGTPKNEDELRLHRFVAGEVGARRGPFYRWLDENIPAENVVFRAGDVQSIEHAISAGAGLGFMSDFMAANHPDLVQVLPSRRNWVSQLWLVTHVDLHRTMKVQAFLAYLKEAAKVWVNEGRCARGPE